LSRKSGLSRKDDMLRQAMSEMGRRGGLAAAKKMTAKQRTERARKAGKARQAKAKEAK
jgi:hypothetical protein